MLRKSFTTALFLVQLWNIPTSHASDVPPSATVLDADIVWDVANPRSFSVSHDGKRVAYISKGAIWVCQVDKGPPTKLADVPNTVTAILALEENRKQRELSAAAPHSTGYIPFYGPTHVKRDYVFSLAWSSNDDRIFFTVMKFLGENSPVRAHHVMQASLTGTVSEIAVIEGTFGVPQEYTTSFYVTPDDKYVVVSSYAPLIWDVQASRPRVTPFELLLPSSTSGHFLGVEIDTRQLVLVDEQFQIIKRFDVEFPAEHGVDLTWSDDERFAVCRAGDNPSTNHATAFRIDLETGLQTPIGECNLRDEFVFVGPAGKLLRLRVAAARVWRYFDGEMGTRVAVLEPDGTKRTLFETSQIREPRKGQRGVTFPPMIAAPDGSHVAAAVPRSEDQAPGAHYHLIDPTGRARPFVPVSDASYLTPYYPIAFAEGGHRLIARSGSALFSIPVSLVAEDREASDGE